MGSVDSLRYKMHKRHEIILSVDLGKARDFSAFVVAEAKPKDITSLDNQPRTVISLEVLREHGTRKKADKVKASGP